MRKTKKQRFRASILAFLLIASMVLGMVPGSAGQVYAKESTSQTSSEEEPGFIDKAVGFFKDTGDKIASFFGAGDEAQPAAAYDETSVVDADTKGSWTGIVKDSTQNIGRIWTDKSVYNSNVTLPGIGDGKDIPITKPEESDFMVGLSALSSTSNTSVTTSTPLDIVLVLDVSGSMDNYLGTTYEYIATYTINTGGRTTYYALDKQTGRYVEVDRVTSGSWWNPQFDHWALDGVKVEPKTSRDDNDPKHIQFYRRSSEKISRINALKDAAGAFVDATAVQNQGINEANQHRLSVVTFSDNGNVAQGLTACNANNAQTIKNTIDELRTGGNTYPGNAMRSAQQALAEARDGAQKVVIFFTDGNPAPAGTNDFNESMANDGVQGALTLKNNKTKIFSIGIFEGADPGNTSTGTNNQFNAYMHAMSSNYPNATAWNQLGERSTDKLEYYYAATSSDELSEIFQHISEEINTGTGYPTETQDGFANKSGHVTFHDQLGDYMQVDSFNKLVLEDMVFENPTIKETAEGVTYTYSGQAGEDKNVSDIVITVTKGTGRVGDTVDVSIPASLLPLRHFKVDVSNNTMTVEDKYPLRLFYNVSLKEDAKKALANPDQEMKNYIANNAADGKVYFYSNKFTGSKPGPVEGQTLGDTTATFEPATGNSFYYFTENTMLWLDEQKSKPATSYSAEHGHDTYYYEKTYYELVNGEPKEVTEMVSFRSHPRDEVEDWVGTATDGQLYIKAGAPRLTRIYDLTASKGEDAVPGTATEVITPNWDDEQAQRNIEVSLGNNGRLAVELPGTLEIKKTVTSEVEAPKDKEFTFTLTLENKEGEALTGEFEAQKFDAQGATSGDPVKVQNNSKVTLKDGESVKIYGLSDGDTYSIEETEIPKGFTAKENPITGTIAGNATVTAEFENTYAVTPAVLDGDSSIHAKKTLTGRDWLDTDSFNIVLTSIENAPLPEASEGITIEGNRAIKTVTKGDKDAPDAFDFGKITFTKPGTYAYKIDEPTVSGDAMIPGIDYSGAVYRVDVVVTDDGEGKLSATSTMKQILDDQGRVLDENGGGIEDEDKIAEITNDFNAQSVSWGARARKEYTDYSGAYPLSLAEEKFSFKIETVVDEEYTEAGPLPVGESSYTVSCGTGGQISFGQATFDSKYVGNKFLYKITEVLPEGVNADHLIKDGMKYDATEYYLELSFDSVEGQDGGQIMRVTPKYMKEVNGHREEVSAEDGVVFTNEYRPTPVVVGDDTNAAIKGSKTLNGRAMKEDEFSFELTAGNKAAVNRLADDSIVFGTDTESNSMTVTAPAADKGAKADFAFGQITFTKPGTYIFNMKEVIPDQAAGGLTYDTHTEVVTVTVTDNNGVLTANTTYDADGAAFVNTYEASHSYSADGGALVTKTLTGRDMKAGEFNFTIEGTGDNKDAADKKLAEADKTFTHYAAKAGVPSDMRKLESVRFTEADAGQTFTYLIKEVIPADDKKAGGVTYDQSEFTLAIAVADDGDGTMSTTTTVTRTKAADGTNVNEIVGTYTSATGIRAVPFVNAYKAAPVIVDTSDTERNVRLCKVLRGRDWHEGESFAFTMMPQDGAPIPAADEAAGITVDESRNVHAVVTAPENGAQDGDQVFFGFGKITYETAGTYVYTVTEDVPDPKAGGMTYSENTATITVTVTDPGTGNLNAVVTVNGTVSGRTFYNDYTASLRHNAAGGIVTTKTLLGHDMADRQFTFQVEALAGTGTTAEENAKRIGISNGTTGTYRNDKAAQDGQKITMKTEDGNDIEFTTEDIGKTFKYQFSEVKGSQAGYTYDDAVYTVELWVTDDGDGTLTLHTKVNNGEEVVSDEITQVPTVLDFTNSYAASGTLNGAANLAGTKEMDGPWEATGKNLSGFQFTITGGDEATDAAIKAGTVVLPQNATVISDEAGNFKFGDITFKKKGTYTFKVSEVVPAEEDKIPGVTYNAAPVTITVNVTDNDNGTLIAELVEGSPELTFTNTYATTEDATFTPSVVKKVEGLDAKEDFTFKLSAADNATKKAINAKKITGIGTMADSYSAEKTTTGLIQKGKTETVYFDALTFTEAGTYKFTVKEINENAPTGWTYDSHTYGITINVTDVDSVLKAQMKITDPNTNSRIFTNSFAATITYGKEGGLNVTKTLNGRTLKAEMFDFTIAGQATDTVTAEQANEKLEDTDKNFKNTEPGENGVAVMSKLGAVKFDETDIGKTYQYAVQEIPGKDPKFTYDKVSATVAIQVLEKDGGLYTETTVTKGEDVETYSSIDEEATAVAPFVNRYTPEIVNVDPGTFAGKVTKVLEGNRGTALEADEFNFQMTITPADETSSMEGVVLPEGANNGTVTAANAAKGLVSFGNIQFKAAGTYHVEISEVIPEKKDPNMTYDKHTFSYDIEVTYDASKGELSTKAVEDSKSGSPVFTNIYEADAAKDVANTDDPTTSVNGKVVGVGDQLTYTIDWVNNAVDETTGAPAKAEVTIKDIVPAGTKFVSAENKGVYDEDTNTIRWTLGEQEAGVSGTVSFVVEVLDSAGGTDVTNKAEITVGDNNPKQTNEVTTNVPGKDSAVEEGGELQVGKILTYTISYKNPEKEVATVTIKDIIPDGLDYVEGSASNGATYNKEDRTLTWTIANVQPGTEGTVTFDAKVNESAETVIDNKATIQIGDNAPTYDTNTDQNEIPKDGNLAISKTIALAEGQGTEINKEQTFTFTVELKDAKGSALTKEYAYTVTDESGTEIKKGKATDGTEISFQHGQKAVITGLPAGAQYTVTEKAVTGYTTSVNGQVGNAASGTIAAEETAAADFTNTYSVTGSLTGSDALTVTKELVGREWLNTDTFKYQLTAADEATKKAVEGRFITLPDNAGGLEITNASAEHQAAFGDIQFTIAGTFKFHVTEQPSGIAGITDDKNAERTVVVKVTDKKDGTLDAVVVKDESDDLTFTNTYGAGTGEDDIAAQIPATKKLTGRDMKAGEFQFEVVTRKADEKVEDFKEEVVATGTNKAAKADATGTVTFAGKDDVKLTYTVESLNKAVEDGYAVKEVHDGQAVWMVSYTARELTTNLPGGVKAVEGKTSYDFGIIVTDHNNGTLTALVGTPEGGIAFENAYTTGGTEVDTDPIDATAYFNKVLTGRDWSESDEFTFTIVPQDGAPAPEKTTATVKKADAKAGNPVPFGFGKITFTDKDMAGATAEEDGTLSKTFTYQITENDIDAEKMPGVTKDNHVATLTITVTDNQQGQLSTTAGGTVVNGTFTNTYASSLDYTALSGLQITKVLNGRDMADGQFTFTVTPEDKDSADKLELTEGATEFTNTAKPAGEVDTMDVLAGKSVTFTQEDAGKTFTYTVAEKAGDNKAYTYDDTPRTVTIEVEDNKNATLTVTTTVKKGGEVVDTQSVTTGGEGQKKATVAFVNTYNDKPETLGGDGEVKINAKKTLMNRPMVDGEFEFHVKDNKNDTVTSGTNSTDGTITFAPVTYDTDKLIKDAKAGIAAKSVKEGAYVYTYDYKVVEDNSNFADGVTGIHTSHPITVIVTDDGEGNLSIEVVYPEGSENVLTFKNIYGADGSAVLNINGHKTLEVESGTNAPDITGKYTFTIEGSGGAPMPEKRTATNDKTGNVDFGAIQYTMEDVFGSEPAPLAAETKEADEAGAEPTDESDKIMPVKSEERTKEFTYTVKESGNVPGVHNDSDKTFKVTVTDNGDGTITVDGPKDFAFEFTNTYRVDPVDYSINTDLTITKELDGRELKEGEFTFELVGEDEKVVSTAQNSADGSVTFGKLTYKVPGTYNYVIREKDDKAGGVEYDSAEHTVVVVVTDNGDGTMTAKAELKSRDGEDVKNAIVFKNSYIAQPASVTLGASKAYTGGELKDGQFTFELKDKDGKVVSKAKNTKEGQIVFETISYDQAGTYEYKISEVNDEQKHVTYDKTVYGVTVTVTDNGEGSLMATVEYDGGKAPVFTNKYSKPAKPAKPEEPKGATAVKTGDEAPVIPFIILMVATLAIIVTITFIFFRRKRR